MFLFPFQGHLKETEPQSSWGPVELVAVIAGPVFLVFVIIIVVVFVFHHHQRVYHNRQRLDMEDPSCEMCLSKDKTLPDLVYDLSTSGSGSGTGWGRKGQTMCRVIEDLCSRVLGAMGSNQLRMGHSLSGLTWGLPCNRALCSLIVNQL